MKNDFDQPIVLKFCRTIVVHSLLHEGPGFPYFAPFVYWYLVTGCVQRALPYVSIDDDLSENTAVAVKKVKYNIHFQPYMSGLYSR